MFLCPLPSTSHIYPFWQHNYLSGHPSIFQHLSHLNSLTSLFSFTQQKAFFPPFSFFPVYCKSFIYCSINPFIVTSLCHLPLFLPLPPSFFISFPLSCHLTFLPIIPLSNPELSYLAAVTAAAVARPQTSASPVPQHLYSADQTNRFNSPKLAVLTAALMCSWPACAKSQLNMLQTHVAYTQYH